MNKKVTRRNPIRYKAVSYSAMKKDQEGDYVLFTSYRRLYKENIRLGKQILDLKDEVKHLKAEVKRSLADINLNIN